ncbi:MAG: DUF1642 domain-containing protein [Lactococcus lactis]|nr:DUF1642 domain-containing protein [Lactococcus lactis]MDN5446571.1 DUF1642 domain-containing protein [Lactococcus lactis]MDN5473927.1 DUF1642 domain-containing protein [Lactococcus lactis]
MSKFSKQFNLWHIVNDKKYRTATLYRKALCKKFRNWKSPEDYSELSQEVRALMIENEKLKADKQLVVVPKFVDEYIKHCFLESIELCKVGWIAYKRIEDRRFSGAFDWIESHFEEFARAWIDGYTVAKEKMYHLKNKLTEEYLYQDRSIFSECEIESMSFDAFKVEFTQSEIDDMETGSYEQIEVTDV